MIRLEEVGKEYGGGLRSAWSTPVRALEGVTLEVAMGTALGVVGPNGAGKSTLLRLLLGYLRPSAGGVSVAGLPPRTYAERHGIGYVPERPTVPTRWTVRGALLAYAALGHVENWSERVEAELRRLGLEELAGRRIGTLSKGDLQRLVLAQALLGDRKLLILDEPTDGVDPEWRARVRERLAEWRAADPERVLLFASHDLDEVERVANRVAVLTEGRLREVLELRAPAATLPPYRLEVHGEREAAGSQVAALFPGAVAVEADLSGADGAWLVTAPDAVELNRRVLRLLEHGVVLLALRPEQPTLEQRFRRSMREEGRG